MTQNYTRGELVDFLKISIISSLMSAAFSSLGIIVFNNLKDSEGPGFLLIIVGLGFGIVSGIKFFEWLLGLTQRIDDTAINTAKTNETLVLILNELKLMHEVETKHKQHFDEYADWMSDTMNTVNNNIIKT